MKPLAPISKPEEATATNLRRRALAQANGHAKELGLIEKIVRPKT